MILTPKLSQISFEALLLGGIGYALGRFANVDPKLSAQVLVIAGLANTILFAVTNYWGRSYLNRMIFPFHVSPQALYVGTNTLVSATAILAAQQLNLISRCVAGGALFVTAAVLLARISLLNQNG